MQIATRLLLCDRQTSAGSSSKLLTVTAQTIVLEGMANEAAAQIEDRHLPVRAAQLTHERRQRNVASRQGVMAANTEVAAMTTGARLAIEPRQAAVAHLLEPRRQVGERLHRVVTAGATVLADVDGASVAGAALVVNVSRLQFMVGAERRAVDDGG